MQVWGLLTTRGFNMETRRFEQLEGKTVTAVSGFEKGADRISISFADGTEVTMDHTQDCCERVEVEEVFGNPNDLVGRELLLAEEVSNAPAPYDRSEVGGEWTFYKFRSAWGTVTVRWLGESDYYATNVNLRINGVVV